MDKIERSKIENTRMQLNQKYDEKEIKNIKQLLDDMLDFLAEMPVDKYHDFRGFRNLHLRQYLIHRYVHSRVFCFRQTAFA